MATQLYECLISRTAYYRVVVSPDSSAQRPENILAAMEAAGEDIEQYRLRGPGYVDGEPVPYGSTTEVVPVDWEKVIPNPKWCISVGTDDVLTADFAADPAGP
jgi:hypothetical protein